MGAASTVPGPTGPAGNTVLYGASNPTAGTGVDGNFYINTTTTFIFGPKASGAWPAGTSLVGPQGPQGAPGAGSPATVPPLMDGTAAVGTSTLFARQDHVHPSDTSIAPILSVNGAMSISQELGGTGLAVTAPSRFYILDMFQVLANGSGLVLNGFQQANASTLPGFPWQLAITSNTLKSTLAAGDQQLVCQSIEGVRLARLGWGTASAQPISIGFWAYCSTLGSGVVTVGIQNGGQTRSYLVDVQITAAATWQWFSVTIPGDTTGTWATDTGIGMWFLLCFGAGSTFQGTAGWQAGNKSGTTGTMNFAGTSSNSILFTGVIIVPGPVTPPKEKVPLLLPTYDQEVAACQRYWNKITASGRFYSAGSGTVLVTPIYFPSMRLGPAVALSGGTISNVTSGYPNVAITASNSGYFNVVAAAAGDCSATGVVCALNARL
jgi:hypothetical protein